MGVVCDVDRVLWMIGNPDPEGVWTDSQMWDWEEQSNFLVLRRGLPLAQILGDEEQLVDALEAADQACAERLGDEGFEQFTHLHPFHDGWLVECESWEEPGLWLEVLTAELTKVGLSGVLEVYPALVWGQWPWGNEEPVSCAVMHVLPTERVRADRGVREQLVRVLLRELGVNGLAENSTGLIMGAPVHAWCSQEQALETLLDSGELTSIRSEDAARSNMCTLLVSDDSVFRLCVWSRDDDSCRNVDYLVGLLPVVGEFAHEVYVHHGEFGSKHDIAYGRNKHLGGDVVFGSDRCVQLVPAGTDLSVPREKGWGIESLPSGQCVLRIGQIDPKVKTLAAIFRDKPASVLSQVIG